MSGPPDVEHPNQNPPTKRKMVLLPTRKRRPYKGEIVVLQWVSQPLSQHAHLGEGGGGGGGGGYRICITVAWGGLALSYQHIQQHPKAKKAVSEKRHSFRPHKKIREGNERHSLRSLATS